MAEQPDPEVGRRVEQLRRRAGLSRERLASLTDTSLSLLKFIETGRRALTLRAAQRLAPVLGVHDLGEFYGPNVRLNIDERPTHPAIPEIRRALTSWPLTTTGEPESPDYIHGALDAAWNGWHTSRQQRTETGTLLPGLIASAQRAARLHTDNERRRSLALLAEVYHLAQAMLAWHGERELIWLTVEKGMAAALDSGDPVGIAGATWYAAHVLRAVGRADEAVQRLQEARALIELNAGDSPDIAARLVDIDLAIALTRARAGDRSAWVDWQRAHDLAHDALPAGYVHPWTRVGPVLVDVYAVMIATDLGDLDEARQRAEHLDPDSIPSIERRSRHLVELARTTDLNASPEATLHLLTRAADASPETVQFSPAARDMVRRLLEGAPAAIRRDVEALAARIDLPL